MKLSAKFNLVLLIIFSAGVLLTAGLMYTVLSKNAREEVLQNAGLMMEAARAMRGYTIDEIKPLLEPHMTEIFFPQTVPAYADTRAFDNFRTKQPDYFYKEATLNPTNPRDRAADWEADIIHQFRGHPDKVEIVGTRDTPSGPSLCLARPIKVSKQACLGCHSTAAAPPVSMIAKYGDANGFGWEMDEIIGAQVVSVPMSVAEARVRKTLITVMGLLVAGFVLIALVLNVMLRKIVVTPAIQIAAFADEISKGNLDIPAYERKGNDEMATLASSFNRLRLSLEKAMKLLDD